jgi:DNA-binding NarL/FixJ family response regulator
MFSVAVVEDNEIMRDLLVEVLKSESQIQHIQAFGSAENYIHSLQDFLPDLVLMDIGLPGMSGIEAIKQVKPQHPEIQYIVFTLHDSHEHVFDALSAGATGYLLKGTEKDKILESIFLAKSGGSPMSSSIARKMVEILRQKNVLPDILSQREQEVILGLKEGLSYQEIAEKYKISVHTVRTHIRSIYEKFQVHSRTEVLNKIFKSY